ncbi:MAG: magnesium transporter CorA family protein [Hyphomicrobiaceae bacterium]
MYDRKGASLSRRDAGEQMPGPETVWLDLLNPTPEEEKLVEVALKIDIPTREELQEIEASSRLYQEDGAHFMTATLIYQPKELRPVSTTVTFVLTPSRLVTIRYAEPYSFKMFADRALRGQVECGGAAATLVGLLEVVIDRQADHIERIQTETDRLSQHVFAQDPKGKARRSARRFDEILHGIGREGDITSRARDTLLSLNRLLTYFGHVMQEAATKEDKSIRARIKTAQRDVTSLTDHLMSLGNQITFLLDAVLGMISIEQNAIIKFFSVVAVVLMPPTLMASVYGLNFRHMPELDWPWGYPAALILMVLAAVLPWLWFRNRGWL